MIFITLLSFLITTALSAGYITVQNYQSTQDYYLTFILKNIDTSTCGDSISNVYIYKNQQWTAKNQQYDEDSGYRVAFDYTDTKFSDMLPLSIRIELASSRTIDLWGIMENINPDATFTSTQTICDGTLSPTAPTPQPTTKTPTAPTTPYPTAESVCIDSDSMQWRSYNNQIYLNGNRFNMKGLSWFGFETSNYNLYGLDKHSLDWYLDWIVDNDFNAIRLPFSQDFVNSGNTNLNAYKNVVEKAGEKGILIMVDFHSATAGSWTDGLNTINHAQAIQTWETMADLLGDQYNVFLADVFNEPHDVDNNEWSAWISFCEEVATALWNKGVNWMIAIEGTNWQCDVLSCSWGENLEGIKNTGTTFSLEGNRFVWSPHVYGGDVSGNYAYSEAAWQSHWGYLVDGTYTNNKAASVIGEFGTKYIGSMQNWLQGLITYLIKIDQRNTFYWCLNPNSGDTGGLLNDDWTTEQAAKLAQLKRLQPAPSKIVYENGRVCVSNLGAVAADNGNGNIDTTASGSDNGSGNSNSRIKISIKEGANQWWFAVVLSEIPSGVTVDSVKVKGNGMSSWEQGTLEWDYYKFTNNGPYKGPFNFKIKTNGLEVVTNNVIASPNVNAGANGYANIGGAYNENNGNNNTLDWTIWFAIIVAALILLGFGIGLIYYFKKRKNKSGHVEFKDTEQIDDINNTQIDDFDDVNETLDVEVEMNVNDGKKENITSN